MLNAPPRQIGQLIELLGGQGVSIESRRRGGPASRPTPEEVNGSGLLDQGVDGGGRLVESLFNRLLPKLGLVERLADDVLKLRLLVDHRWDDDVVERLEHGLAVGRRVLL